MSHITSSGVNIQSSKKDEFKVGDWVVAIEDTTAGSGLQFKKVPAGSVLKITSISHCGNYLRFLGAIDGSHKMSFIKAIMPEPDTKEAEEDKKVMGLSLVKDFGNVALAYNGEILPYQRRLYIESDASQYRSSMITVEFYTEGLQGLEEND